MKHFWYDAHSRTKEKKVSLQLIPFKSEEKGQSKADWIKENASDFDLFIDDNPEICKDVVEWDSKQEIERSITDLLNEHWCFLCDRDLEEKGKDVERKDLAGFHHSPNSPTEIEQPICSKCWKEKEWVIGKDYEKYCSLDCYIELMKGAGSWEKIFVFAPYYPAIKHDERVLLVKQEVVKIEKWEK